jgi:predicted glutamine amidotransferase
MEPEWEGWSQGIFHTRAASTGAITIENQHPFVLRKFDTIMGEEVLIKQVIGIHNGVVSNHELLNKQHNRKHDCDTPHVFEAIVGNSKTNDVYGYGNLAWYETTPDNPEPKLHFLKFNADNLNIVQLATGELVFCSTQAPIIRAAYMAGSKVAITYMIEGDKDYTVEVDSDNPEKDYLHSGTKMVFGIRTYSEPYTYNDTHGETWYPTHGGRHYGSDSRMGTHDGQSSGNVHSITRRNDDKFNIVNMGKLERDSDLCMVTGCSEKVRENRRKQLICELHMAELAVRV